MMTMNARILVLALLAGGCRGHAHDDKAEDHGHPHGGEAELPGQAVTTWAERTELFMEYQPLIVGKETRFAAHVTAMPSFKAVTAGSRDADRQAGGRHDGGRHRRARPPTPASSGRR